MSSKARSAVAEPPAKPSFEGTADPNPSGFSCLGSATAGGGAGFARVIDKKIRMGWPASRAFQGWLCAGRTTADADLDGGIAIEALRRIAEKLEQNENKGALDMTYDGRAVANFVLDQCDLRSVDVSNLSLQKIVYFCHVWSLIGLGKPLIRHSFEAWEYGPVLPYLYREFKEFERSPIRSRATEIDRADGRHRVVSYFFEQAVADQLEETVRFYSRMRAADLVAMSHVKGGPWDATWNHVGNVNPGMKIGDSQIAAFYSKVRCPFSLQ